MPFHCSSTQVTVTLQSLSPSCNGWRHASAPNPICLRVTPHHDNSADKELELLRAGLPSASTRQWDQCTSLFLKPFNVFLNKPDCHNDIFYELWRTNRSLNCMCMESNLSIHTCKINLQLKKIFNETCSFFWTIHPDNHEFKKVKNHICHNRSPWSRSARLTNCSWSGWLIMVSASFLRNNLFYFGVINFSSI